MVASLCESSQGWCFSLRRLNVGVDAVQRSGAPKNSGSWREIGGRECDRVAGAKRSSPRSSVRLMGWGNRGTETLPTAAQRPSPVARHEPFLKSAHIFGNLVLFIWWDLPLKEGFTTQTRRGARWRW